MRPRLLFADRDFELRLQQTYRQNQGLDGVASRVSASASNAAVMQDLELEILFEAMAARDEYLREVARAVLPASLEDPSAILYRQQVLSDCLLHPPVIRDFYRIAVEGIEAERTSTWGLTGRYPDSVLYRSLELLKLWLPMLRRLRALAHEHGDKFRSQALRNFVSMLAHELSDDYLELLEAHVRQLRLRHRVLISAQLGQGNKGTQYTLRRLPESDGRWLQWMRNWISLSTFQTSELVYEVAERDESGLQTLAELQRRGISAVARALGQSTDHILGFFWSLRSELAFLVGCLNLRDRLTQKGEPVCLPQPLAAGPPMLSAKGVYDVSLALSLAERVVGNDVAADGKSLVMITGANQGGKSTFTRAIGQAQLMMQAGMFVPAISLRANVCHGVYTHFKREEEAALRSGKLDEELRRMRAIVERLKPSSMLLLNESLASTNEREGSEIARQIVQALLDAGVKVIYVTHLFDLAQSFYQQCASSALFLRAERYPDGSRTFRIHEGEPLPTSHGADLYRKIFGSEEARALPHVRVRANELPTGSAA